MRKVLVTGCAGFIGYHLAERLLADGDEVVGLDCVNDYYDPTLKRARLKRLARHERFSFHEENLADRPFMETLFAQGQFEVVFHLAAQAGVRYSIQNPWAYIDSNVVGFLTILEGCRHHGVGHLVFASSSSVYGSNTRSPFAADHPVDHPISLYAATKKSNEVMAHAYAHLYDLPCTGMRFFTVYGPWGRPDMAMFLFAEAILAGKPINVFNHGNMRRDFTYVDDCVESIVRLGRQPAAPDPDFSQDRPNTSAAPFRVYNIGNGNPVQLMDLIAAVEEFIGQPAEKNFMGMQAGDVPLTAAAVDDLARDVGYRPDTPMRVGVKRFIDWYLDYYGHR